MQIYNGVAKELAGRGAGLACLWESRLTMFICQDELKLLRVRTRKQELVIVPDAKYLLIVIHETPAA